MSSETRPGKWKTHLFSQDLGALSDGSSLPSRTAQIKVPKPYLLQGEALSPAQTSHHQLLPSQGDCPPLPAVAYCPSLDGQSDRDSPLSQGHLAGTPDCSYPPLA